jgi:holin-like protein
MKLFKELSIIFSIYLLGETIAYLLNTSFPGGVIGMFILFILLYLSIIKENQINIISDFVLNNMPFFFVPAGVGIMAHFYLLEGALLQFSFVIIVSTSLVLVISGILVQALVKKREKHD